MYIAWLNFEMSIHIFHIFFPFHTVHGVLKARILEWYFIYSPSSGPILPEFFTKTHPSWAVLYSMAHRFIEICKFLSYNKAVVHEVVWHRMMSLPGQIVSNMLLGKSSGQLLIAPERMKWLGQSRNNAQVWMHLVVKVKSNAIKYCIETWMLGPWIKVNWTWSSRIWKDWTSTS